MEEVDEVLGSWGGHDCADDQRHLTLFSPPKTGSCPRPKPTARPVVKYSGELHRGLAKFQSTPRALLLASLSA